jgi:hypothetical protein
MTASGPGVAVSVHPDGSGTAQTITFVAPASGPTVPAKATARSAGGAVLLAVVFEIVTNPVEESEELVNVTSGSGLSSAMARLPADTLPPVAVKRALHAAEAAEGATNADTTSIAARTSVKVARGLLPSPEDRERLMMLPDSLKDRG